MSESAEARAGSRPSKARKIPKPTTLTSRFKRRPPKPSRRFLMAVSRHEDWVFWPTVIVAAVSIGLLLCELQHTKVWDRYLGGVSFVAAGVALIATFLRFVAHGDSRLNLVDRLGKGLAVVAAGIGVVGVGIGWWFS